MRVELAITSGSRAGHHELLEMPLIRIGRHPANDVRFHPELDTDVSGMHCEIKVIGARLVIHDSNSTNGTFVNGTRVTTARLALVAIVPMPTALLASKLDQSTRDQAIMAMGVVYLLLAGLGTPLEKIRAIAAYVQKTSYISVQMNLTRGGGYTPHRADDVLTKNYGDCKDKATLLATMLREVGVPADLALLRTVDRGVLDPTPISGVPKVHAVRLSGLMEVLPHPNFAQNQFVYLTYTKDVGPDQVATALARGKLVGNQLTEVKDLLVCDSWAGDGGSGSRLAWGKDGMLYMTTGASNGNAAQEGTSLRGKILRLRDDGTAAPGNPFAGKAGYKAEIFTMGHRNSLGLALNPVTGVRTDRGDGLTTLTLNRPEKQNAITRDMYQTLANAIRDANGDFAVRAVVITHEGPHFTAGNDLYDFLNAPPLEPGSPVMQFLEQIHAFCTGFLDGLKMH